MAKQRKQKGAPAQAPSSSSSYSSSEEIQEIPESEQWRIIEQTGVLKKIPQEQRSKPTSTPPPPQTRSEASDEGDEPFSPLCNEIFYAICFTIPFSSLYVMMNVLAHRQYSQEITVKGMLDKILWGVPSLFLMIFYSMRYKADRRVMALMFTLSVVCGCRLIYIVNWASWRIVVEQSPSLGTVWVYTIVHLNLLPAVIALAVVAAYVKWKDLKIIF